MTCQLNDKGATIMIHTHQTAPTQLFQRQPRRKSAWACGNVGFSQNRVHAQEGVSRLRY